MTGRGGKGELNEWREKIMTEREGKVRLDKNDEVRKVRDEARVEGELEG